MAPAAGHAPNTPPPAPAGGGPPDFGSRFLPFTRRFPPFPGRESGKTVRDFPFLPCLGAFTSREAARRGGKGRRRDGKGLSRVVKGKRRGRKGRKRHGKDGGRAAKRSRRHAKALFWRGKSLPAVGKVANVAKNREDETEKACLKPRSLPAPAAGAFPPCPPLASLQFRIGSTAFAGRRPNARPVRRGGNRTRSSRALRSSFRRLWA